MIADISKTRQNVSIRENVMPVAQETKEFEMLVTSRINIFSFLFGKQQTSSRARVNKMSKAQPVEEDTFNDLESRMTKAKSENYNTAHTTYVFDPFGPMNK